MPVTALFTPEPNMWHQFVYIVAGGDKMDRDFI